MSLAYRLTPWKAVARPHADVTGGALDMGTYAVNLGRVFRGGSGVPDVYASPQRFFSATYFTDRLRQLLFDIQAVLSGSPGNRVLQLRTPFGGGKTHALVALLHLARDPSAAAAVPELAGLPQPGAVRVAVLSGEELDPLNPTQHGDGVVTHTLWGELAAQLGRFKDMEPYDRQRSAPGGNKLRDILGEGPVLLLLDEVLVYVEKGMAIAQRDSTLGRQAMLFMEALTEVANNRQNTALVYSLQASVGEAAGAEGLLAQLEHLVSRVDAKREPVSGDEVMRVVQRRLFAEIGPEQVRRDVATAYAELLRRQLQAQALTDDERREAEGEARRLQERILGSYPFHPALLDLMHHRWGSLPSYQRTRGALQFLACVIHDVWERGVDSALIGPGEVNLADDPTRGAFFSQVGERERYASVLDADVISEVSGALKVDRRIGGDSPALEQLAVGSRMATAIMLYSFGSPEGEDRGVLESDLVSASLVPGLDRNVIIAALHDLREEELYLHYTGRRYRFEPVPNLSKLVRDEADKFSGAEVLRAVRDELERQLTGEQSAVVWPERPDSVRDRVPRFQVAYLYPDWVEARQPLRQFVEEAAGGKRAYRNAAGFAIPDASQFDRARAAARLQLACDSLLGRRSQLGFTEEQVEELKEKLAGAKRELHGSIMHAYSHAALPVRRTEADGLAFEIEQVDLRSLLVAGKTLHARIMEALSHRVFHAVTVDKLISLAAIGSQRNYVPCPDLVDWFFSYFEFPKLTNANALQEAIGKGVTDGRLGYTVGFELVDGEPLVRDASLVRFRTLIDPKEIDLGIGGAVLSAELAGSLETKETSTGLVPPPSHPPPIGEPEKPEPRAQLIHNLAMRFRVDGRGLFGLQRALSWLRERSAGMDVEVTVRAQANESGYDPVSFRNGVTEPLLEAGVEDLTSNLS